MKDLAYLGKVYRSSLVSSLFLTFAANYSWFRGIACVAIEFKSGLSDLFFTLPRSF